MRKYLAKLNTKYPLERVATVVGVCGHMASYIQALKIFYLHSAQAVSLVAAIIGFVSILCWLMYGLAANIQPLIISNIVGIVGVSLVIGGVLCYG